MNKKQNSESEILKEILNNSKKETASLDSIEHKKIDFKIETVNGMLEKWSEKKNQKSEIQMRMIKSFFWFLVAQSIFLGYLIKFEKNLNPNILYWYLAIFVVQVIGLITISHRYMFSDNEDKILEIAKEIIKED